MKIDRGTHVWWGAFKKGVWHASLFLTLRKQNASWGTIFYIWRENLDNLWCYQKQYKMVFMINIQPQPQFGGDVLMINMVILILSSSFNDNILLFELLMVRLVPSITRWCLDPLVAWPAPLTPGLDPPLEEKRRKNDSEFKEISDPNSDWSEPLWPLGWTRLWSRREGTTIQNLKKYLSPILSDQTALLSPLGWTRLLRRRWGMMKALPSEFWKIKLSSQNFKSNCQILPGRLLLPLSWTNLS